jgi:nucleoid-associated protein EbfC
MGKGFSKQKKQMKKMQQQFTEMQDQIENMEVSGSAGNGLVTVILKGNMEVVDIKIKPECVDTEDIEGLEDLIKEAYKNAFNEIKKSSPDSSSMSLDPSAMMGGGFPF